MQTEQRQWRRGSGWRPTGSAERTWAPDVAFAFGSRAVLSDAACMQALRAAFPGITLIGCSTAGEICGRGFIDAVNEAYLQSDEPSDREASLRAGFAAHLVKPVGLRELLDVISAACDADGPPLLP